MKLPHLEGSVFKANRLIGKRQHNASAWGEVMYIW